jgi:hypothetical protein
MDVRHRPYLSCRWLVGFEVFTAVAMKSIIFWDVTPCSLLRCHRRFGGTYRLHFQGRRTNFQQEPARRINCEPENWCIYRKQKVRGKWSSVPIGWSDEVVNTHGLNHQANGRAQFSSCLLFPIYTPVFRLAVYSACHLLTCWFLPKKILDRKSVV